MLQLDLHGSKEKRNLPPSRARDDAYNKIYRIRDDHLQENNIKDENDRPTLTPPIFTLSSSGPAPAATMVGTF
jgi:hypothetical protein